MVRSPGHLQYADTAGDADLLRDAVTGLVLAKTAIEEVADVTVKATSTATLCGTERAVCRKIAKFSACKADRSAQPTWASKRSILLGL